MRILTNTELVQIYLVRENIFGKKKKEKKNLLRFESFKIKSYHLHSFK